MDEADQLPEYMRTVYRFILSTCEDYERDALKLGKAFATPYFIETVSSTIYLCKSKKYNFSNVSN